MAFQLQSCLHGHGVCLKLQTKLPTLFRCCLNGDYTKKPSDMDLQFQIPLHNGLPNHFPKGTWKIPPTNVHPPTASNVISLTSIMSSIFIKGHLPPPQQSIYRSVVDSTGHWQDLDTFTQFRFKNVGAWFGLLLMEVANDEFLPAQIRNHPTIEQVTFSSGIHAGFVNDIMSHAKEVEESNPRNLVSMLMNSENLLLPQAIWRTVDVVNSHSHVVVKAAADASLTWKSEVVRKYVEGAMHLMSGTIYWHNLTEVRYQHPNSIFPELRSESDLDVQLLQEIFLE